MRLIHCGSAWLTVDRSVQYRAGRCQYARLVSHAGNLAATENCRELFSSNPFRRTSTDSSRTMQFFDVWVRNAAPGMYEPGLNVSSASEPFSARAQVELTCDRFVRHSVCRFLSRLA